MDSYKLVLLGDTRVGKTSFVRRHATGEFSRTYEPSRTLTVGPLKFHTTAGRTQFSVWECPSQGGLGDSYYIGADCAIIMFDRSRPASMQSVANRISSLQHLCPEIPIVIVGSHADIKSPKYTVINVQKFYRELRVRFGYHRVIAYYDISSKSNYNFEKPFLALMRKLKNDQNLQSTEHPLTMDDDQ